jgi:hypothetical protein
MTLILGNDDIERVLEMKALIPALEDSYIELSKGAAPTGRAATSPRRPSCARTGSMRSRFRAASCPSTASAWCASIPTS